MKCIGWCERIMPTATCCPGTGMSQSQRKIQSMSNEGKKIGNFETILNSPIGFILWQGRSESWKTIL